MEAEHHRGAFGEFGGESRAFIERTFRERIVVVGLVLPGTSEAEVNRSLDELEMLVDTAGADVVARVVQKRRAPDPATWIGRGKVAELRAVADAVDADTIVFDDELTPAQQSELEKLLGRSAIDRTAVILDIFAQNAHSQEGMVQVELAQLRYRLPRLRGRGHALSQQAGGIGTRGPGETQLEVDRRRIERRIHKLERDLSRIGARRATQRRLRHRRGARRVAIVGYTNAGKSTLLNALTGAGVLTEDRLFATLDPATRRMRLDGRGQILVSDTVGFIRKLPHQLVEAFKSTLEVVREADLLVHVVDISGADPEGDIAAVRETVAQIGADQIDELLVFNKIDMVEETARGSVLVGRFAERHPGCTFVSALTGEGIDDLVQRIAELVFSDRRQVELTIPYERADLFAYVRSAGEVLRESADSDGFRVLAKLDAADVERVLRAVEG